MTIYPKRLLLLTGTLLVCVHGHARDVDERLDAPADGIVHVTNTAGSVTVQGWQEDAVQVTGELGSGIEELEFQNQGRHTIVKVLYPEGSRRSQSSHIVVNVPEDSELVVDGVSADIEVSGVFGVQRLQSISGEVTTEAFDSDLEVKTVSGELEITGQGSSSLVTVTTVSGDADITGVAGEIESSTVSGDMRISAGNISRARLKTTSGDIELKGGLLPEGRLECESINGDIEVELADASNITIDVETFSGDIDSCFDTLVERKSEYGPGRLLRFSQGAADRSLRIKTLNGDVEICDD